MGAFRDNGGGLAMSVVLVVDDDLDTLELLRHQLSHAGYTVVTAPSVDSAHHLAVLHKPHVIVLDVMMAGKTGFDFCRNLRKDPQLFYVGVLFCSGMRDKEEIEHAIAQGGDDYLTKPVARDLLLDKVDSLMRMVPMLAKRDPVTGFHGALAMRRMVTYQLLHKNRFALAYVTIVPISRIEEQLGVETSRRVLTLAANVFRAEAAEIPEDSYFLAHAGFGYFMIMVDLNHYSDYLDRVCQRFDAAIRDAFPSGESEWLRASSATSDVKVHPSVLHLRVTVTHTGCRNFHDVREMFDALQHTSTVAEYSGVSQIFVDRQRNGAFA